MNFCMSLFDRPFVCNENQIAILVIENNKLYQETIQDFILSLEGEEPSNSFFIGEREVNLYKEMDIITDLFNININQTKNLTKLYNHIKKEISIGEYFSKTVEVNKVVLEYMSIIAQNSEFTLDYNEEFDITAIFKALNLNFYCENMSILEKLIDYITIMKNFFNKNIFIITNFKTTFSIKEQMEFYKFINYSKTNILFVESVNPIRKINIEIYRIIDNDLCVIY